MANPTAVSFPLNQHPRPLGFPAELPDVAAIRFNDGSAVELERAFDVADAYEGPCGYLSPEQVIWADGSYSYAKGWWDVRDGAARLCRIGAGAYGNLDVAVRTFPREPGPNFAPMGL